MRKAERSYAWMKDVGRVGLAMLAAATLNSVGAAPAQAQFGNMIKGMVPGMAGATGQQTQNSASASKGKAASNAEETGAMGLREPTALPPLKRLGTDAVAVVEQVKGTTAVRPMDYVFAKQSLALGKAGTVTMSYLSGCLTETVVGGTVTVGLGGSKVVGGKLQPKTTPGCRATKPVLLASASEAGATVNRVTPFSAVNWDERALKSRQPVFKWDASVSADTLRIRDMDKEGEPVVWETPTSTDFVNYPSTAAPLATGAPYKVEAMAGGKVVASALFSIDPALDVPETVANRLVPLAKP